MNKTETKTKFNTVAYYFLILQGFGPLNPTQKFNEQPRTMLLCFRFKFRTLTSNPVLYKIKKIRLRSEAAI